MSLCPQSLFSEFKFTNLHVFLLGFLFINLSPEIID